MTAIVEGAVARVQGVTAISSSSSVGQSRVTLEFSESTNLDIATSDVRDALSRVTRQLPDSVEAPTIFKADSDAQPIMQLAVTADSLSIADLSELVDGIVTERLAAVEGVAEVQVYGTRTSSFEVDIDPVKLASHGLTVADIRNALSTIAFDSPPAPSTAPTRTSLSAPFPKLPSPAISKRSSSMAAHASAMSPASSSTPPPAPPPSVPMAAPRSASASSVRPSPIPSRSPTPSTPP